MRDDGRDNSKGQLHRDVYKRQQVPRAINACTEIGRVASVGVIEVFSLCAAVLAADAAAKAADVRLMEVRLGRGLGGKSFIALTGEIASVQAAIDAARAVEGTAGLMNDSVVIPAPHPDMIRSLY